MSILVWIVTGIIAGWLAGMIVSGGGYGLVGDLSLLASSEDHRRLAVYTVWSD